jgi:hypothetical protein
VCFPPTCQATQGGMKCHGCQTVKVRSEFSQEALGSTGNLDLELLCVRVRVYVMFLSQAWYEAHTLCNCCRKCLAREVLAPGGRGHGAVPDEIKARLTREVEALDGPPRHLQQKVPNVSGGAQAIASAALINFTVAFLTGKSIAFSHLPHPQSTPSAKPSVARPRSRRATSGSF